jgi:hypothetical protein
MHIPLVLLYTTLLAFVRAIPSPKANVADTSLALPKWTLQQFQASSSPYFSQVNFTFIADGVDATTQSCTATSVTPSIYGWGIHQCGSRVWFQLVEDHVVLRHMWKAAS